MTLIKTKLTGICTMTAPAALNPATSEDPESGWCHAGVPHAYLRQKRLTPAMAAFIAVIVRLPLFPLIAQFL